MSQADSPGSASVHGLISTSVQPCYGLDSSSQNVLDATQFQRRRVKRRLEGAQVGWIENGGGLNSRCFFTSHRRYGRQLEAGDIGASLSVTIGVSIGVNPTSASASPSVSLPSAIPLSTNAASSTEPPVASSSPLNSSSVEVPSTTSNVPSSSASSEQPSSTSSTPEPSSTSQGSVTSTTSTSTSTTDNPTSSTPSISTTDTSTIFEPPLRTIISSTPDTTSISSTENPTSTPPPVSTTDTSTTSQAPVSITSSTIPVVVSVSSNPGTEVGTGISTRSQDVLRTDPAILGTASTHSSVETSTSGATTAPPPVVPTVNFIETSVLSSPPLSLPASPTPIPVRTATPLLSVSVGVTIDIPVSSSETPTPTLTPTSPSSTSSDPSLSSGPSSTSGIPNSSISSTPPVSTSEVPLSVSSTVTQSSSMDGGRVSTQDGSTSSVSSTSTPLSTDPPSSTSEPVSTSPPTPTSSGVSTDVPSSTLSSTFPTSSTAEPTSETTVNPPISTSSSIPLRLSTSSQPSTETTVVQPSTSTSILSPPPPPVSSTVQPSSSSSSDIIILTSFSSSWASPEPTASVPVSRTSLVLPTPTETDSDSNPMSLSTIGLPATTSYSGSISMTTRTEVFTSTLTDGSKTTITTTIETGVLITDVPKGGSGFARKTGAIIGVSVTVAVVLIAIVVAIFLLCKRCKPRRRQYGSTENILVAAHRISWRPPLDGDDDEDSYLGRYARQSPSPPPRPSGSQTLGGDGGYYSGGRSLGDLSSVEDRHVEMGVAVPLQPPFGGPSYTYRQEIDETREEKTQTTRPVTPAGSLPKLNEKSQTPEMTQSKPQPHFPLPPLGDPYARTGSRPPTAFHNMPAGLSRSATSLTTATSSSADHGGGFTSSAEGLMRGSSKRSSGTRLGSSSGELGVQSSSSGEGRASSSSMKRVSGPRPMSTQSSRRISSGPPSALSTGRDLERQQAEDNDGSSVKSFFARLRKSRRFSGDTAETSSTMRASQQNLRESIMAAMQSRPSVYSPSLLNPPIVIQPSQPVLGFPHGISGNSYVAKAPQMSFNSQSTMVPVQWRPPSLPPPPSPAPTDDSSMVEGLLDPRLRMNQDGDEQASTASLRDHEDYSRPITFNGLGYNNLRSTTTFNTSDSDEGR